MEFREILEESDFRKGKVVWETYRNYVFSRGALDLHRTSIHGKSYFVNKERERRVAAVECGVQSQ